MEDESEFVNPEAVRPSGVADDDPTWDSVGSSEPCDWCARPGRVERWAWWRHGELLGRNPSLCGVCAFWLHLSGDVVAAIYQSGDDYGRVSRVFDDELCRKWRAKVAEGRRMPQGPGEEPDAVVTVTVRRTPKHADGFDSPELAALASWRATPAANPIVVSVSVVGDRAEVLLEVGGGQQDWVYCVERDGVWREVVSGNGPVTGWDDPALLDW